MVKLSILSRICLTAGLVALTACPSLPGSGLDPVFRGGPEPVTLPQKPFENFTYQEEQGGRWLAGDLFINTDKTLSDPIRTLQTFAQLEYTANQMKGVYRFISPGDLNDLLQARQTIRTSMDLPDEIPVDQAIQSYTARSQRISETDLRLLAERHDVIRGAMVKAGRSFERYARNLEAEQQRSPTWPPN
jgi:hypothetical protein